MLNCRLFSTFETSFSYVDCLQFMLLLLLMLLLKKLALRGDRRSFSSVFMQFAHLDSSPLILQNNIRTEKRTVEKK